MLQPKQVKRKLSDTTSAEPPKFNVILSPFSQAGPTETPRDNDLVSAAKTLTRLPTSASPPPPFSDECSNSLQVASPLSPTSLQETGQIHPIVQLVNTISRLPLVSNAVRYYETSKRNYATFNYAAGIVEKAAMPVFSKIEVNLNSMHQAKLEERARLKKKRKLQGSGQEKHEVKRRIKFCLHILKLANDNISAKVNDLQERIKEPETSDVTVKAESPNTESRALLNELPDNESSSQAITPVSSHSPHKAVETNNEIVATVKKIVHVISNFRPSALNISKTENGAESNVRSDEAKLKRTIREIILSLPKQVSLTVPCAHKAPNQAIGFARESLDMIGRLTSVFNEQLEKAEDWVDGFKESVPTEASADAVTDQRSVETDRTKGQQPGLLQMKTEESFHSLS